MHAFTDDLVPPEVVIVGGHSPTHVGHDASSYSSDSTFVELEEAANKRISMLSDAPSDMSLIRERQGSVASSTATSRQRFTAQWSPEDNEDLRRLCEQYNRISDAKVFPGQFGKLNGADAASEAKRLREERRRLKQEIKDKGTAIKAQERADRTRSGTQRTDSAEESDLSFADMLDRESSPRGSDLASSPNKEALRRQRESLKAQSKALKESERAHKEAEKLARAKAAIQARNDKIDAHDRAVREKASQKAAQKAAKAVKNSETWNLQARRDVESTWGVTDFARINKSQVVRI